MLELEIMEERSSESRLLKGKCMCVCVKGIRFVEFVCKKMEWIMQQGIS